MAIFVSMLLVICYERGVKWIVEQPGTSTLYNLPCFEQAIARCKAVRLWTALSPYGGDLLKPSCFYSTLWWIPQMYRKALTNTKESAEGTQYWSRGANGGITGKRALKGTEHYPTKFCSTFAKLFAKYYGKPEPPPHTQEPTAKRQRKASTSSSVSWASIGFGHPEDFAS